MLNPAGIEPATSAAGRARESSAERRRRLRLVDDRNSAAAVPDYYARALALWPRLDRARLARVRHDRDRLAALIARRTALTLDAIVTLLRVPAER